METKMFEVRDRDTFIPVLAIVPGNERPTSGVVFGHKLREHEAERALWARSGYGKDYEAQSQYVILMRIEGTMQANYDVYEWGQSRTLAEAHQYIINHWSELSTGDVIDVEFILGETTQKKTSELAR